MIYTFKLTSLILFLVTITPAVAQKDSPALSTWPMKLQPLLSSSFMEWRHGHFHAGIDLKTKQKEGYRVYAVGQGSVVRIRTSPWNYGKAMYLKLSATGETVIYAHLKGFVPRLEKVILDAQRKNDTYQVDVHLPEGRFTFKEGELIGYSGSTGTGHPHLHFEIRDKWNRPVNPHKRGYSIKDNIQPFFDRVAFIPLDHFSFAQGLPIERIIPFKKTKDKYTVERVPSLYGKIGIAVEVFDRADGSMNRLGIHRLKLYLDGEPVFEKIYNHFEYSKSRKVYLDRNFSLMTAGIGLFHNLYMERGNDLDFYTGKNSGILTFDDEHPGKIEHQVTILAEDFSGNVSTAVFEVRSGMPPEILSLEVSSQPEHIIHIEAKGKDIPLSSVIIERSLDNGEKWLTFIEEPAKDLFFKKNFVFPSQDSTSVFRVLVSDTLGSLSPGVCFTFGNSVDTTGVNRTIIEQQIHGDLLTVHFQTGRFSGFPSMKVRKVLGFLRNVSIYETGLNSYCGRVKLKGNNPIVLIDLPVCKDGPVSANLRKEFTFNQINHIKTFIHEDPCGIKIECPPETFYRDTYIGFETLEKPENLSEELRLVSDVIRAFPQNIPLARSFRIGLLLNNEIIAISNEDSLKTGIVNPKKVGIYRFGSTDGWKFQGSELNSGFIWGKSALLGDFALLSDEIPPEIIALSPKRKTSRKRPFVSFRVMDKGSGISRDSYLQMWFDKFKVYAEYDPEKNLYTYQVRNNQKSGKHSVRVRVRDNQGNEKTISWTFRITG